jgi:hypothetical protein
MPTNLPLHQQRLKTWKLLKRDHTLDPVLCGSGDLPKEDLPLERSEYDQAKFDCSFVSLGTQTPIWASTNEVRRWWLDIPLALTRPVPCPIKPSDDSSRS